MIRTNLTRRLLTVGALTCSLMFVACSKEQMKSFSDLAALRQALIEEYQQPEVNVVIQNSNMLGVAFINSSFNQLGDVERAKQAQKIALFVKDHYASIGKVERIWVAFATSETYFFVFHRSDTLAFFMFDKNNIEGGDLMSSSPKEEVLRATASYAKPQDTTTVKLNHLRLYGDFNNGLLLIPSFSVRGDKVSAPEWVELEFASYSDRERYSQDRRIALDVDQRRVVSGQAKLLSSGKGADGIVSEFLTYRISYRQFLLITSGDEVKLSLGSQKIYFTTEHLELLRSMKECVDASWCQ